MRPVVLALYLLAIASPALAQSLQPTWLQTRAFYCLEILSAEIPMEKALDAEADEFSHSIGHHGDENFAQRQSNARRARLLRFLATQNWYMADQTPLLGARIAARQDYQRCQSVMPQAMQYLKNTCHNAGTRFTECTNAATNDFYKSHPNTGCEGVRMCNGDLAWLPY